jgi:hypothetical protein
VGEVLAMLYNFQSVYITVYRHKQPFYIDFIKHFGAMKCASAHIKSLSSDVANFRPIRAHVITHVKTCYRDMVLDGV